MFWLLNCGKIPSVWLQTGCHFSSPLAPSQCQPRASDTNSFFCRDSSLILCSFPTGPVVVCLLLLHRPLQIAVAYLNSPAQQHTWKKMMWDSFSIRTPVECEGDPNCLITCTLFLPQRNCVWAHSNFYPKVMSVRELLLSPYWILNAESLTSSSALLRTFLFTPVTSYQSLVVLVVKDVRFHPFIVDKLFSSYSKSVLETAKMTFSFVTSLSSIRAQVVPVVGNA